MNLIKALQHYHHLQYGYGQLSGETVHVDLADLTIKLSNVLEPEPAHQGSLDPSDVDMPTVQQRDNYAVLQMLNALFREELEYEDFDWLCEAFLLEFEQKQGKYLDLSRFRYAVGRRSRRTSAYSDRQWGRLV